MQYFKKSVNSIKNIEFFKGYNIFDKMKESTFGIFHNNINKMDIPIDEFKLPIIVIIGNESSGKSSLISNILKCDIFPINKNRCTKCPIKIELINSSQEKYIISFQGKTIIITNKEQILETVSKLMIDIDDIIEDELHIQFSNPNVITSTYYDLPGIIEYPDNLRIKSKTIVNKYIIQENTLIICVIPASTPRLTSNQALGLIIDAKKTKDCIIALSMVDLLHDDDIELFINRILMKSDEINKLDIHNIIGLSNNNKINEKKWFSDNILTFIDNKDIEVELISKITIENLLKSVDIMYDNYIKINWKGKAITTADKKISLLNDEYKKLGSEDLTIKDVYNHIKEILKLEEIFNFERTLYLNRYKFNEKCHTNDDTDDKDTNDDDTDDEDTNDDTDDKDTNDDDDTYDEEYYGCTYKSIDMHIEFIKNNYNNNKSHIYEVIISILEKLFEIDDDFKLKRFILLKDYIKNNYIQIIKNEMNGIDEWFNKSIEHFKYDLYSSNDLLKLEAKSHINFKRYILTNLIEIKIEDQTLLKENNEWIEKRNNLKEQIEKYNNSKTIISNL